MSVSLPSNFNIKYKGTGADLPSTATAIPGVTDFDPGARAADQVDATDYDSTGDAEEVEAGIKRSSPGTLVLNFEPANTVHEDLFTKEGKIITLIAQDATKIRTMNVLVLGVATPNGPPGTLRKMTLSIKLTGPIVRTTAP